MHVALVEDDLSQAKLRGRWLRQRGHQDHQFDRGTTLIRALGQNHFDALVLDWNLGDITGFEVLRRIRDSDQWSMPVLFVSARSREVDVVNALHQGADDYMITPVRNFEFIARLEAIVRRGKHHVQPTGVLKLDVYHVDCLSRTLTRRGRRVDLTVKDFDLSVLFLRNLGQLLSRSYICEQIWGRSELGTSRTLDTHISHVRRKLGLTPENGWRLESKYRYGYRLQQLEQRPAVPPFG